MMCCNSLLAKQTDAVYAKKIAAESDLARLIDFVYKSALQAGAAHILFLILCLNG